MGILTRYERRILEGFSTVLLPKTDALPDTPSEIGLVDRVDRHLSLMEGGNIRFSLRVALWIFQIVPVFYRGRTFLQLSESGKLAYMEGWRGSHLYPKRLLYKLLVSICYVNYYSHPQVSKRIGYVPPPIRRSSSQTALPVELHDKDVFLKADVCVIGSGAGGAVVAKELAEKGRSVVLLEEGGNYDINDFGREALEIVQRLYRSAGFQVTVGLPCIILPTGRAVGGTTIINSGTCFRLPDRIFARWQNEFGLKGVTAEALAPYFDRVEKHLNVVAVTEEVLGNNSRLFRRGLEKLGLHGGPLLRNVKGCDGAGMCCFGCPTDAKQSVQISYLPRAIEKGARLFVHCRAEQIIPKQGHGAEVIASVRDPRNGSSRRTVRVDAKVVVLAAGTLGTPELLRRNQIASHNPHIGRHLTIHPTGKVICLFDEEVRAWEGVPQGYSYEGMSAEGIVFEGAFTPPSFGSFLIDLPPMLHKETMKHYGRFTSFGFLISDEARGWIRWLPNGDPIVYYSIRKRELAKYIRGIRFLTEVFLAAGAKKVFTGVHSLPVITPEMGLKAFDDARINRTDLEIAAFHPLGTCRMGEDPNLSVVDSFGEMHAVKNLFIADGSIFPTSPGVNPQETIMAFANRTADYIHSKKL